MIDTSNKLRRIRVGYIENNHLRTEEGSLLPRIGLECPTCHENKGFTLLIERYTTFPTQHDTYYLQCDYCVERIGLDDAEVVKIEKIAKLNEKYKNGKISKDKYDIKIEKIILKR